MTAWNDFNSADDQNSFDTIPSGTKAKVRMTIKPGGFDEPSMGWTGGYATQSESSDSIYLSAEFVVLEGPYAKRKIWSLIGLYSPNGPEWANMGRSFVKGILNSAKGLNPKDDSQQALEARRISGFADLDGIEFVAKIGVNKDRDTGELKNVINTAITPDNKDYAAIMGNVSQATANEQQQGYKPQTQQIASKTPTNASANTGKPAWAQ